jgi:hypothetical protein
MTGIPQDRAIVGGTHAVEGAAKKSERCCENGRCEGADYQAPHEVRAEEVGDDARRHSHNQVEPATHHGRMVGRRADITVEAPSAHRFVCVTNALIWSDAGLLFVGLICTM